jgi:hypothetical protein
MYSIEARKCQDDRDSEQTPVPTVATAFSEHSWWKLSKPSPLISGVLRLFLFSGVPQ